MSTRESGSSTQSTGTSCVRRPRRWASTSSSVSKNQPWSRTSSSSPSSTSRRTALKPHCASREARAQRRAQDPVVAARDELALRAADDPRAVREPRADGQVAVARHQRRDEREQPAQVRREVDVHVADDLRRARRPGGAQRAAAALLLEPQVPHGRERQREPARDLRRRVDAGVVGDHDPPAEREAVAEEAVQPADAALEAGRLVVHGNDDLDLRRGGRERAPGGSQQRGGELWHDSSIGPGPESPLGSA